MPQIIEGDELGTERAMQTKGAFRPKLYAPGRTQIGKRVTADSAAWEEAGRRTELRREDGRGGAK